LREIVEKHGRFAVIAASVAAAAVCAALAVHLAHTLFGFAHPGSDFLIEEWIYDFVTATAAVAVATRVVIRPDNRVPWGLVAGGLGMWAASDIYWSIEFANLEESPFPSICDAGYLAGYALMLAGVGGLVRGRVREMNALVWADMAIAALCVAAIGTTVLMDFVLTNTTGTTLEIGVALAYPLLDLATLTIAIAALALTGFRPGWALGLVATGIALSGVGDAVYTYQSLAGTYEAISWNNSLWPLGTTLIALAALLPLEAKRTAPNPESWRSFAAPGIFALAILSLLLTDNHNVVVESLTVATLVAIVLRLALTFRENRRLVTELKQDALTRLGNRSKLLIELDAIFHQERPETHTLSILDLDGFKAYNDAFGHPAGDSLLIMLAGQLAAAAGGRASAYRLGGDEFAVLAPGGLTATAPMVADCVRALSESGEGFQIGASMGTAEIPAEAITTATALQLADSRMYENKDSRRPSPGREVEAVLVRVLQHRAPELGQHGRTVAALTASVASELAIPDGELTALLRTAELHDIGKMAIPDAILQKPGPLDDHEWEFMRQHTILGERILSAAPSLGAIARLVRSTHERWDGKGYPDGLKGDETPFAARIVFVCDAYDAIVTERPYSAAESHEFALAELRRCAGTMFDPDIVEALCRAIPEPPASAPDKLGGLVARAEAAG
jgi:diguanylate cyclase (GGDEF)-like protein